jgi:hypothetical protein
MAETDFMVDRPRRYTLVNAGDEDIDFTYGGNKKWVPRAGRLWCGGGHSFDPEEGSRRCTVPHCGRESEGEPGQLVIQDHVTFGPGGEQVRHWDATACVVHILGRNGLTGPYAARGLRVVPDNADKDKVLGIMADGRGRWEKRRYEEARAIVDEEAGRQEVWKKTGKRPPPASPLVRSAAEFLETYEAEEEKSRGAFVCRSCGLDKKTMEEFKKHADRVHPATPVAELLVRDEQKLAAQAAVSKRKPEPEPEPEKPKTVPVVAKAPVVVPVVPVVPVVKRGPGRPRKSGAHR